MVEERIFFKELINDVRLTSDMKRSRSGVTQLFRKDYGDRQFTTSLNADVILTHERPEMYAELIDNKWYWVNGCSKCEDSINFGKTHSYSVCHEHNRCNDCGTHRSDLTETPWGTPNGFRCKPCQDKMDKETLRQAMQKRATMDDSDFCCSDNIFCPHCGSNNGSDVNDFYSYIHECNVCNTTFSVQMNCTITFTTLIKDK